MHEGTPQFCAARSRPGSSERLSSGTTLLSSAHSVIAFSKVFYPEQTPFIAFLLSLGTFAVGFVARPVGGIFFGYLGDRIGRRYTLIVTLMVMGIATLLIGLLPGYQSIGAAAPTLLIVLRLLQGFSLGGEFGGVATLLSSMRPRIVVERWAAGRRRAGSSARCWARG